MGAPLSEGALASTLAPDHGACYAFMRMADPRALEAVRRIERALARIEAAASRPASAAPAEPPEDYERLREAHHALRQRVVGAIGEIDRLIETGEAR